MSDKRERLILAALVLLLGAQSYEDSETRDEAKGTIRQLVAELGMDPDKVLEP